MTESKIITKTTLAEFINQLIKEGKKVVAPKKDVKGAKGELVLFSPINSFSEITFDYINTNQSVKEFFFPMSEKIFCYRYEEAKIKISPADLPEPLIIFGSRPCDAAGIATMEKVFNWDYKDSFFNQRRELHTIISLSCADSDAACFCTSLNGGWPGETRGSDILLTPINSEEYLLEAVTEKGEKLTAAIKSLNIKGTVNKKTVLKTNLEKLGKKFTHEKIKPWLDKNFEHPLWEEITRQCIGCGTCTFLCPTCHCFDLVDEATLHGGAKYKNWDACQMRNFTLHASGHNPRATQSSRHRQRIMHKYKYYPDRFNETLCTGCGRCVRSCPVDLSIIGILKTISDYE